MSGTLRVRLSASLCCRNDIAWLYLFAAVGHTMDKAWAVVGIRQFLNDARSKPLQVLDRILSLEQGALWPKPPAVLLAVLVVCYPTTQKTQIRG